MRKVISIKKQKEHHDNYMHSLNEAIDKLYEFSDKLFDDAVALAINGVWKDWSDTQPAGTKCEFTEKMLLDSGDENVKDMVMLGMKTSDLANSLQERFNVLKKKGEK